MMVTIMPASIALYEPSENGLSFETHLARPFAFFNFDFAR